MHPSGFHETREFKIRYGLTKSPMYSVFGELKYTGILKISPEGIGIYRTGEVWLGTLLTLAMSLDWWGRQARPEISTSVSTDGTPEHIIDPGATDAFYDRRRDAVVLQVPGTTGFIVKLRKRFVAGGGQTEDLLQCLSERLNVDIPEFKSKRDFLSMLPILLLVALLIAMILLFCYRLFRWH